MVHFNDGASKEVDFYPFLNKNRNPMNKKYLDVIKFKNFEVKHNALSWNDYEVCFHIDSLKEGFLNKKLKQNPALVKPLSFGPG
jgi:hypothetical protein